MGRDVVIHFPEIATTGDILGTLTGAREVAWARERDATSQEERYRWRLIRNAVGDTMLQVQTGPREDPPPGQL